MTRRMRIFADTIMSWPFDGRFGNVVWLRFGPQITRMQADLRGNNDGPRMTQKMRIFADQKGAGH